MVSNSLTASSSRDCPDGSLWMSECLPELANDDEGIDMVLWRDPTGASVATLLTVEFVSVPP